MPVERIEVYPTCEIHLLKKQPAPMRLVVRESLNISNNLSRPGPANKKTEVLDFDTTLVDISQKAAFIEFSPKTTVGKSTIGRIRHSDTSDPDPNKHFVSEVLVRVSVHNDVEDFWNGNNRVTLYKNESNYVLSVYAKFDDGSFGDISSHRYLNFATSDAAFVEVNNADDRGRITGKQETTGGPKQVTVTLGTPKPPIDVHVVKPLSTPKPILECIYGSAVDFNNRHNILIISEGFTQSQESDFRLVAQLIAGRLMEGRDSSPYNLLKDKFNVWIAFDPSSEDGLTVGHPVHKTDGRPIQPSTTTDPATALDFRLLQARDSKFGLMYGLRYGDRRSFSQRIDPANPPPFPSTDRWFIAPDPVHWLFFDRRRNRIDWKYWEFLDDYLGSLRVNPSKHTGPQNINAVWKTTTGGKDRNLVCILANDDHRGGFRGRDIDGVKVPVKRDEWFNNLVLTGNKLDHTPRVVAPAVVPPGTLVLPSLRGAHIGAVTGVITHEFAHSFDLGDEYEAFSPGMLGELLQTNLQKKNDINKQPNLTHHWLVKDANGKIDLSKVVWNKWMRVDVSSALTASATNTAGNTKIQAQINPTNAIFWLIPPGFKGRKAYLRTRDINFNVNSANKYIEGPFEIEDIDLKTGKITLKGKITKNFPKGSVIYVPKERTSNPLSLIEPLVAQFISTNNNGEPFAKKTNCNTTNRSPSNAPSIPNLSVASQQLVVGVYEGGGTFNCKVYRPCGQCRMRDTRTLIGDAYPPFCPVCKYHLANRIDPDRLLDVELEYPKQEPVSP